MSLVAMCLYTWFQCYWEKSHMYAEEVDLHLLHLIKLKCRGEKNQHLHVICICRQETKKWKYVPWEHVGKERLVSFCREEEEESNGIPGSEGEIAPICPSTQQEASMKHEASSLMKSEEQHPQMRSLVASLLPYEMKTWHRPFWWRETWHLSILLNCNMTVKQADP